MTKNVGLQFIYLVRFPMGRLVTNKVAGIQPLPATLSVHHRVFEIAVWPMSCLQICTGRGLWPLLQPATRGLYGEQILVLLEQSSHVIYLYLNPRIRVTVFESLFKSELFKYFLSISFFFWRFPESAEARNSSADCCICSVEGFRLTVFT